MIIQQGFNVSFDAGMPQLTRCEHKSRHRLVAIAPPKLDGQTRALCTIVLPESLQDHDAMMVCGAAIEYFAPEASAALRVALHNMLWVCQRGACFDWLMPGFARSGSLASLSIKPVVMSPHEPRSFAALKAIIPEAQQLETKGNVK